MNNFKDKYPVKFIIFAALLLVAIFVVENINKRFWLSDFKVYYGAANALMNGTQVYGIPFTLGSGNYKYSPFTVFLVLPLSFLPYYIASVIAYFLIAFAIVTLFVVTFQIVNKYLFDDQIRSRNWLLAVTFICVINHLVRELHLGNINLLLLLMLCFSLLFILREKFWIAGLLLAIVIMTKPFFVLLILPLMLRKNYKVLFAFGISMVFCLLFPALLTGFPKDIELHKEWVRTMIAHTASFPSNNTIDSLVRLYLYRSVADSFQFFVMIAVCIGYFIFFFVNRRREKKDLGNEKVKVAGLVMEWFVLIAIMPSLFRTDTNHFLLSLPLIMCQVLYVSSAGNYYLTFCFILLVILFGGNSSDMVGKMMSSQMDAAGILGISNLLIIFFALIIYFKRMIRPVQLN